MNRCPRCDTEYEGDFCPRCGSPAEKEPVEPYNYPSVSRRRFAAALKYVPSLLFAVYAVLLLLFYLMPATHLGFPSLYEASKDLASASALIAFGVISLILALLGLILLPYPFFDLARIADKPVSLLRKIWKFLPFALYFILYSLACSMTFYGGASIILVITFTLIFALAHGITLIVERNLLK